MALFEISKSFEIKKLERKQDKDIDKGKKKESNLLLAKFLNIGYYLVTPLLLGVFFGLAIDDFLKTKPLLTIIFLILGALGAFYNLWKLTKEV